MGQEQALETLVRLRAKNDNWYSAEEVADTMRCLGVSEGSIKGIHKDLFKMTQFNLIQAKAIGTIFENKLVFRAYKTK